MELKIEQFDELEIAPNVVVAVAWIDATAIIDEAAGVEVDNLPLVQQCHQHLAVEIQPHPIRISPLLSNVLHFIAMSSIKSSCAWDNHRESLPAHFTSIILI